MGPHVCRDDHGHEDVTRFSIKPKHKDIPSLITITQNDQEVFLEFLELRRKKSSSPHRLKKDMDVTNTKHKSNHVIIKSNNIIFKNCSVKIPAETCHICTKNLKCRTDLMLHLAWDHGIFVPNIYLFAGLRLMQKHYKENLKKLEQKRKGFTNVVIKIGEEKVFEKLLNRRYIRKNLNVNRCSKLIDQCKDMVANNTDDTPTDNDPISDCSFTDSMSGEQNNSNIFDNVTALQDRLNSDSNIKHIPADRGFNENGCEAKNINFSTDINIDTHNKENQRIANSLTNGDHGLEIMETQNNTCFYDPSDFSSLSSTDINIDTCNKENQCIANSLTIEDNCSEIMEIPSNNCFYDPSVRSSCKNTQSNVPSSSTESSVLPNTFLNNNIDDELILYERMIQDQNKEKLEDEISAIQEGLLELGRFMDTFDKKNSNPYNACISNYENISPQSFESDISRNISTSSDCTPLICATPAMRRDIASAEKYTGDTIYYKNHNPIIPCDYLLSVNNYNATYKGNFSMMDYSSKVDSNIHSVNELPVGKYPEPSYVDLCCDSD